MEFADKAHDKSREFNNFEVDLCSKDKELYAYLFIRLNKRMTAIVTGTDSGFDIFRRIVREEDPVSESMVSGSSFNNSFNEISGVPAVLFCILGGICGFVWDVWG